MADDRALLGQYSRTHDAEAFAELVRRHAGLVYGASVRVIDNPHDAEDVAQECFLELARNADAITSSVAAWLHLRARSRAVDAVRRRDARRRREEQAMKQKHADSDSSPAWAELAPHVDQALAELPEELRAPLVLHYLEAKSQVQVAQELGVNQSTVSRRIEKGTEQLQARLKKLGVVASAAVLAGLLSENAAMAAPSTLIASLGKMALAGVGQAAGASAGAAAGTAASATAVGLSALGGKLTVAIVGAVVAAAVTIGYVATTREEQQTPSAPQPPQAQEVTGGKVDALMNNEPAEGSNSEFIAAIAKGLYDETTRRETVLKLEDQGIPGRLEILKAVTSDDEDPANMVCHLWRILEQDVENGVSIEPIVRAAARGINLPGKPGRRCANIASLGWVDGLIDDDTKKALVEKCFPVDLLAHPRYGLGMGSPALRFHQMGVAEGVQLAIDIQLYLEGAPIWSKERSSWVGCGGGSWTDYNIAESTMELGKHTLTGQVVISTDGGDEVTRFDVQPVTYEVVDSLPAGHLEAEYNPDIERVLPGSLEVQAWGNKVLSDLQPPIRMDERRTYEVGLLDAIVIAVNKPLPVDVACTVKLRIAQTGGTYQLGGAGTVMLRDRTDYLHGSTLKEPLKNDIALYANNLPQEKRREGFPLTFEVTLEPSLRAACDEPRVKAYWPRPIKLRPLTVTLTAKPDQPEPQNSDE